MYLSGPSFLVRGIRLWILLLFALSACACPGFCADPPGDDSAAAVKTAIDAIISAASKTYAGFKNTHDDFKKAHNLGEGEAGYLALELQSQFYNIEQSFRFDPYGVEMREEFVLTPTDRDSTTLEKYIEIYRRYLADRDAEALRKAAREIESKLSNLNRENLRKLGDLFKPKDGPEFFEVRIDKCGGFFRYHLEYLKTHLAYIERNGHAYAMTGESLSEGIARWNRYYGQLQQAIDPMLKADTAWADLVAKKNKLEAELVSATDPDAIQKQIAALDQRIAQARRELHEAYKKALVISSQRISGIEFRVHDPQPAAIGVFVVDERPAQKVPSRYASLLSVLTPPPPEPATSRTLFVLGRNLALKPGETITFPTGSGGRLDYKLLETGSKVTGEYNKQWDRGWELATQKLSRADAQVLHKFDAILVRADLHSASGGFKELRLTLPDGRPAAGIWPLDGSDIKAHLRFVRPATRRAHNVTPTTTIDQFIPVDTVFPPERVWVEIATEQAPELDHLDVVVGDGEYVFKQGGKRSIRVQRLADNPRIFRSGPLQLYQTGDRASLKDPGVVDINVKKGQTLLARLLDDSQLYCIPPFAHAAVERAPKTLWVEALKRAGADDRVANWQSTLNKLNGVRPLSDDEVGEIASNFLGGSAQTNTKIQLGHLAAMILLRETFVEMAEAYKADLTDKIKDDDDLWALARAVEPHFRDPEFRFGSIEVAGPPGAGNLASKFKSTEIRNAFDLEKVAHDFVMPRGWETSKEGREWAHAAFKEAFKKYGKALDDAIARAKGIQDGDVQGLFQLTGAKFEPVVERLLPRLVHLIEVAPMEMEWVADPVARGYVSSIPALAEKARAMKEADDAFLTVMSLWFSLALPITAGEGVAGVTMSMAMNFYGAADVTFDKVPQWFRDRAEFQFALGSMEIINGERLDVARVNQRPIWSTAAMLALSGFYLGLDTWNLAHEITAAAALARANTFAGMESNLLKKLRELPVEERAEMLRAMEVAEEYKTEKPQFVIAEEDAEKVHLIDIKRYQKTPKSIPRAEEEAAAKAAETLEKEAAAELRQGKNAVEETPHPLGEPFKPVELAKGARKPKVPNRFMPEPGKPIKLITPKGERTFHLGDLIGKGGYAHVYDLKDAQGNVLDEVIKFYQDADVVRATEHGSKLLEGTEDGIEVLQLKISEYEPEARLPEKPVGFKEENDFYLPFVVQKKLDTKKAKTFGFDIRTEKKEINGILRDEIVVTGVSGGEFGPKYQRAVARLFKKLAQKRVIWEDSHLENMYFVERGDGTVEAGILDQDRMMRIDEPADPTMVTWNDNLLRAPKRSDKFFFDSLLGSPLLAGIADFHDPKMLMAKLFEYRRRWIWYDRAAGEFKPILMDPKIIEEEFGDIKQWVDYDFTKPRIDSTGTPAPGLAPPKKSGGQYVPPPFRPDRFPGQPKRRYGVLTASTAWLEAA